MGTLLTGLVRMELAALFWGGSFVLLFILSWFTVFFARRRILHRHPDPLEGFETSLEASRPWESMGMAFSFTLPGIFLPALKFTLNMDWPFTLHRRLQTETRIYPGENQGSLVWKGPRGVYTGTGVKLRIGDYWGFIRSDLEWLSMGTVTVFPEIPSADPAVPFPSGSGDRASRSPRRERNSELLEVRKYYPGDDFRRINWKVYAHMGELFLRIGEENPPPEAQIALVFDLGASGCSLAPGLEEEFLDHRIAGLGAAARSLTEKGYGVVVLIPGFSAPLVWGTHPRDLSPVLAGLKAAPEPQPLPATPQILSPAVLFTHPLSPKKQSLITQLEHLGSRVLVESQPWPWPEEMKLPWFRRKSRAQKTRLRSLRNFQISYKKGEGRS